MKVVIDIDKYLYNSICNNPNVYTTYLNKLIREGTLLPKGHGDLKDVNDIWNNIPDVNVLTNHFTTYDIQRFIDNAPTIIEADKES